MRKRKARNWRTKCFRGGKRFLAVTGSSQPRGLLQLYRDPYLPDIRSALFAAEEPILEQINRALIVPFLRAVQSQFINQTSGHTVPVGIKLKHLHSLCPGFPQNSHRRNRTGIVHDVRWIIFYSFREYIQGAREIPLHV